METIYQREYVSKPGDMILLPGFSNRPCSKQALSNQTAHRSRLKLETNLVKRDAKRSFNKIMPLLEYQLWLEAGKLDKASFKSEHSDAEVCFNSNLWRNFRNASGLMTTRKGTVSEAVSTLYPINIPSPSQIGMHTLSSYYQENKRNMFKTDKTYKLAVARSENEATIMKYLRLKSEMRNPPLDFNGNILPPKNFKIYPPSDKAHILAGARGYEGDNIFPHLKQNDDINLVSSQIIIFDEKKEKKKMLRRL